MIEVRTYRDTDPAAPKDRRFLALCKAGRVSVTVHGSTKKEAETAAHNWLKAERKRTPTRFKLRMEQQS